jgi:methionine salvage enolase-phosphatase E1
MTERGDGLEGKRIFVDGMVANQWYRQNSIERSLVADAMTNYRRKILYHVRVSVADSSSVRKQTVEVVNSERWMTVLL